VTASILAHQILCPPIVGLADNGDFSRITDHLGLTPEAASIEDRYVRFIVPRYSTGPLALRRYMSSEILLAGSARLAALPLSPTGTFDLRWVGMVHSLALLGAAVVLWKASRRLTNGAAVAAGSFAAFAFTDVGYVAPLNSFYAQVASFVFLFWVAALAAVSLADGGRRAWPIAGYFAAAFLFVASKPQEALQSIPLALFGAFLARRPGRRWIAAAGAALLFAASGALFVGTRGGFQQGALYKLVFFEILPRSTDPAADLRALGLDPAAARYSGTTNYGESSPFRDPLVRGSLFPKLGYRALSRFYLTHPARVADELLRGAPAGMNLCASYGNFAKSAGLAPGAQSGAYRAWTKLRLLGVGSAPLVLGLIYGANLLLSLAGRVPAAARVSLATLVAMGALAFAVCTLFSAQIDLPRKLYVFHAITDLLLVADLALAGRAAAALRAK
jgi:hypothetical protein